MKLVFLGTGSAFTLENYQSNMVVEVNDGLLLIVCGSDARRSAANLGWSAFDIMDVYVSHLHADHIGGLEWLGFVSYFGRSRADPSARPRLHIRRNLIEGLWYSLHGGMGSLVRHVCSVITLPILTKISPMDFVFTMMLPSSL